MISRVKRYFLEIKDFSNPIELNIPENYQIILDDKKNFELNKFFYKQIGVDHYWRDRLIWSDKEWLKYAENKNLETHILKKGEDLVGFYEQEYHSTPNEVELINMGILKEFRGLKLGSILLNHAIASASRKNPDRMWVHTCSLDHKHALQNLLTGTLKDVFRGPGPKNRFFCAWEGIFLGFEAFKRNFRPRPTIWWCSFAEISIFDHESVRCR